VSRPTIARLAVAAVVVVATVLAVRTISRDEPSDPGDPQAFCAQLDRLGGLVTAAEIGPEDVSDVPAAQALAEDIAVAAEALRPLAHEDIADDVRTLSGVTAALARDLRDFYGGIADDPSRASDPAYLDSFEPVTEQRQKAVDAAGERIRPWVADHCGSE